MQDRMIAKNGAERVVGIQRRLVRVGQASGINFSFGGKTGNTRDSHRLLELAASKGPSLQNDLVNELFSMHFENDGDITNRQELIRAGVIAGLKESEMWEYLQDDNNGLDIDRRAGEARASGVSSVPTFEIQGRRLEGASEASDFYEVFIGARDQVQSNR